MNKKMRELLAKIEEKTAQAKGFLEEGENKDVTKATALLDEADALKAEFEAEKRLYEAEKEKGAEGAEEGIENNRKKDAIKEFADMARRGFKKSMNEGTPADGGYTVPEDIQTSINTYRESKASLLNLVTVEKVTTNKGERTFKKRSQQTGFTKVGEGGKITKTSAPQFERLSYEIDKYAGYFPVTNELLADSDANIANTLIQWIGDESRVTANKLILDVMKTDDKETIESLDDIKKILNVTLGSAFKATSRIVTNDNGLQWLDTLKDSDGNYLLQPSPTEPMKMVLTAGATTIPVEVIPNTDLPNDGVSQNEIPFYIGDLKEGVVFWDRQLMSIAQSNIATIGELNAFEEDLTIYRAIEREDVTLRDKEAFVYATLTVGE